MSRASTPGGTPVRHDDEGNLRPKAWAQAKRAFGRGDLAEQLLRLERCGLGCPRVLLAAAVHHFLTHGALGRSQIIYEYLKSFAPPAESLPADELAKLVELELSLSEPSARRRRSRSRR